MPEEKVESFGKQVPLGRAGQPAELAPVYVLLASDESSYVSGARVAVDRRQPDPLKPRRPAVIGHFCPPGRLLAPGPAVTAAM